MQRLIHYSSKPLGKLWSITSQPTPESHFDKPSGLWVSAEGENDWKEWCSSESFHTELLDIPNEIHLKPDANILWLRSGDQLDEFTKMYGRENPLAALSPGLFREPCIDWSRVAQDYQGIVISPYQWSRRMERFTSWYYGWDCASGCIWNVEAIDEVSVLESTLQSEEG